MLASAREHWKAETSATDHLDSTDHHPWNVYHHTTPAPLIRSRSAAIAARLTSLTEKCQPCSLHRSSFTRREIVTLEHPSDHVKPVIHIRNCQSIPAKGSNLRSSRHCLDLTISNSSPAQENVEVLKAMVPHATATSASNRRQLPRATAANSNSALANRGDILIAVGPEAPLSIQINCHLSSNWSLRI